MMRAGMRALVVVSMLCGCVCGVVAAEDWEKYRGAAERLIADEATPDIGLSDRFNGGEFREGEWPDEGALRVTIRPDYRSAQHHYLAVDGATGQAIGYIAPDPPGPVPMKVMPPEQAVEIATDFCTRHVPELSADGGDVQATVDETIGRNGARMVHLQRTVSGVNVPTLADIGVRVYDGKVVYMRRKHEPLDAKLQLPGEMTLEQAKDTASRNVPWDNFEAVLFFDCVHEVIGTDDGQRNVWTVWAELKTKNTKSQTLERFNCWHIDANSGEVVDSEWSKPTRALYFRYQAAGGEHSPFNGRPGPPLIVEDAHPLWSPDGSKIAFLSDRARPGYPAWMKKPRGLFVVKPDGSDLKCLAGYAFNPRWSPDGERILYVTRPTYRLCIVSASRGEPQELVPPKQHEYVEAVWLGNDKLVVDRRKPDLGGGLVVLDLAHPEAEPQELAGVSYAAAESCPLMGVTADGKSVICAKWAYGGTHDQWDLLKVKIDGQGAEPEVVCEQPHEGRAGHLIGTDKVLLWDNRLETHTGQTWMVDLKTGLAEEWKPPDPWLPEALGIKRKASPDDVCFTPDGARITFVTGFADPLRERGGARLIWTSKPDGSDLQQVTPWENPLVPMAGE